MKKLFSSIRGTFISGLIFLLPILVVFVLLSKVFHALTGLSNRIAGIFGLKSIAGISGGTIVTSIGIIIVCIICGYLMKISTFKFVNRWLDRKLETAIPGYKAYRDMALSKIENKEEVLPYLKAVWVRVNDLDQPGFLTENLPDGSFVVFVPLTGNSKQGNIYIVPPQKVRILPEANIKSFLKAIDEKGIGIPK